MIKQGSWATIDPWGHRSNGIVDDRLKSGQRFQLSIRTRWFVFHGPRRPDLSGHPFGFFFGWAPVDPPLVKRTVCFNGLWSERWGNARCVPLTFKWSFQCAFGKPKE